MKRSAGILMHISSLPSDYGIGTLGKEAYKFADFLKLAKQSYWQILPICPAGKGNSPYSNSSTFAFNHYFIDLDLLYEDGLLKKSNYENIDWGQNLNFIDYKKIHDNKLKLLKIAFNNFKNSSTLKNDLQNFLEKNIWINEYALFMALKEYFGNQSFIHWPDEIKKRTPEIINKYKEKLKNKIEFFYFTQFMFFKQWNNLKKYVNSLGIKIIGDIPFYVGLDSADVFFNKENFLLNDQYIPKFISGCPPDVFSPNGQVWDHPIYDWAYMKKNDYSWWINRLEHSLKIFDVVRIDHFRGFESFFCIPYADKTAKNGFWKKGPGMDLFNTIKNKINSPAIIAEDLGYMTKEVKNLLNSTGFPGMHVLELNFGADEGCLPHSYKRNSVAYTGTHDNNTLVGWLSELSESNLNFLKKYTNVSSKNLSNWDLITLIYRSVANLAIIPMQDFLSLNQDYRMNVPSSSENNWRWRINKSYNLNYILSNKIKDLVEIFER